MAPHEPDDAQLFHEAEESVLLEHRDNVSDNELVPRMLSAPDCCGEILVELSEFVSRRNTSGAR